MPKNHFSFDDDALAFGLNSKTIEASIAMAFKAANRKPQHWP
jgi:hypothetical protein